MVKIRFTRMGRKNYPYYRIVLVDSRRKRDGAVLQQLGTYNPFSKKFTLDKEKTLVALKQGAQPSETILNFLKKEKIWQEFIASKQNQKKKKHRHSKKTLAKKVAKKKIKKEKSEKEALNKNKQIDVAAKSSQPAPETTKPPVEQPKTQEQAKSSENKS